MAHVSGPSLKQLDERGGMFAAEIKRAMSVVMKLTVKHVNDVDDLNVIRTRWNVIANESLSQHLFNAWADSAEDTYDQLVKLSQRMDRERQGALLSALFIPKVVSNLAQLFLESAINRLFSIGELVWNTARKQMLIGMEAGESITEIRNRLTDVADLAAPQAEVVARTEVMRASNAGSFAEMKATELPALKEWIATEDKRTRETHRHVDGQWKSIDEKFIVGGFAMSYPHDPAGPPEEVINCRCTLGWEIPDEEFLDEDDDMVASGVEAFHLPGRHDQKDHGRKGLRGLTAGKPLKITHGLVHKKHADGSIVAVTKDGKKHILWEANKYHLREKDDKGLWQTKSTAIKSKAYKEINEFAPDWHEPDNKDDGDKKNDEVVDKKVDEKPEVAPAEKSAPKTKVAKAGAKATTISSDDEPKPGDPLKITHGLVHAKHLDNSTIAVSSDGNKKVDWNGKSYDLSEKNADGIWELKDNALKSAAYKKINDFAPSWAVPEKDSSKASPSAGTTPTPTPTPTPLVSSTVPNSDEELFTDGPALSVDDAFINQDFPNDSIIAVSKSGLKKVVFKDDAFEVHRLNTYTGEWSLLNSGPREHAVSMMKAQLNSWFEPEVRSKLTPTPVPTPTPAVNIDDDLPLTIPNSDDAEFISGEPLDLSGLYLEQDFPNNSIVAVSDTGETKLVLKDDYYEIHELSEEDDTWTVVDRTHKNLVDLMITDYDGEWYEPLDNSGDDSAPEDAPVLTTPPSGITTPSNPKTYTLMQKAYAQSIFGSNGVKWHSDSKKMYDAALEVSQKDPSLSMADALAIMDKSLLKKTGDPFTEKITKFLGTKAGKKYAQEKGGSAPVGAVTQNIKPSGPPPAASTDSKSYKDISKPASTAMQKEMDVAHPPPWTYEQRSALRHYTGSAYTELNKCLRGTGACSPSTLAYIKNIKAGMKPSTRNIKLYRKTALATFGVSTVAELEALAGSTIKDDGIISTSISEGVWHGAVRMKIEAPKGSNMAWVQPISLHKNENEFVLAPGTEFEVISVERDPYGHDNSRIMRVRIVPGSGDLT